MSLFNFKLLPVEKCLFPTTESGEKHLSWYWLTDSHYHIQLGNVSLYENSQDCQQVYPEESAFLRYPYIHFLEDLFQLLPQISVSMPPEIFAYINTPEKYKRLRDQAMAWYDALVEPSDEQDNVHENLSELIWYCCLDSAHLAYCSHCCFYHVGDEVFIQYDFRDENEKGIPVWSAGCGQYIIPYHQFVGEVENLLFRFFCAMDAQVDIASQMILHSDQYLAYDVLLKKNKQKATPALSVVYLRKEHVRREREFTNVLSAVRNNVHRASPDWEEIKKSVDYLLLNSH